MSRLPSLNGLRAFEAAGRHLSVTQAARELCVSQAAVSRQIRQLEEQLGVQLFVRSNRGLGFTEIGRQYFEIVSPALAEIQTATRALTPAASRPARRLVMAVDGAFNATWLVRRLGAFRSQHPDIEVEVMVTRPLARLVGRPARGCDAQIAYGKGPWSACRAARLVDFVEFPVCAPALGAALTQPGKLTGQTLIHEGSHLGWRRWLEATGTHVDYLAGPIIHDSLTCLRMAMEGAGVAIGDNVTCADALRDGQLVRPFPETLPLETSFYLLIPEEKTGHWVLDAFAGWLTEELAASVE